MSKKKPEETPEPVYVGPMASQSQRAVRETIESIVIAFILAFLFRTFEAEAFVIPTGSMAPTLHGMHKDLECPQCGTTYRVGASQESPDEAGRMRLPQGAPPPKVEDGICPQCGYVRHDLAREPSYGGDRILVNKFAYQLAEPDRWDVIVFRFPGDAKMNYIKRLIGLPNEIIEVFGGDIFTRPIDAAGGPLAIARKPHRKLRAMLQHVDDNHHIPKMLNDAGWPRRWQADPDNPAGELEEVLDEEPFRADGHDGVRLAQRWKAAGDHPDVPARIEFRHFFADQRNWDKAYRHVSAGREGLAWQPHEPISIGTISDFYSYNTGNLGRYESKDKHWVGDLAVSCDVDVAERQGKLTLVLEEGGYQFRAVFDFEKGAVALEIAGHDDLKRLLPFGDDRQGSTRPTAVNAVALTGKHKLMFANCDDKLYVWIDDKPVEFDGPTEYASLGNDESTPDDLVPAQIAMRGFKGSIDRIGLERDVYYIALRHNGEDEKVPPPIPVRRDDQGRPISAAFKTGPDQFFALGDNSPESKDGRIWNDEVPGTPHVVDRRLLIGKALFIYWPYGQLLPRLPLFERFKLIR